MQLITLAHTAAKEAMGIPSADLPITVLADKFVAQRYGKLFEDQDQDTMVPALANVANAFDASSTPATARHGTIVAYFCRCIKGALTKAHRILSSQ